jgi:hypothetical protein
MKGPDEMEAGHRLSGPAHRRFESLNALELHPDRFVKQRTLYEFNPAARWGQIVNLDLVTVLHAAAELYLGSDRKSRPLATWRIMRIFKLASGYASHFR